MRSNDGPRDAVLLAVAVGSSIVAVRNDLEHDCIVGFDLDNLVPGGRNRRLLNSDGTCPNARSR